MRRLHFSRRADQRGAVTIIMALALVVVLGFAALVIDIGNALVTKAELQNSADAGVLAATRELGVIYNEQSGKISYDTYTLTGDDQARILAKAQAYTKANKAAGAAVELLQQDEIHGTYDKATGEISESDTGVRAIKLTTRRDESVNGELPMMLARVLGTNSLAIDATSSAALTPLGSAPSGWGEIPVGISEYWFESNACGPNSEIKFHPTNSLEGCAGWHTFDEWPASAAKLNTILQGLEKGTYQAPATTAGVTSFNFIGGSVASRFSDIESLYNAKKDANGEWKVHIPVYEANDCKNPSGEIKIVGFATSRIYAIEGPPALEIKAHVECDIVDFGTGSGPNDYGTLHASPSVIN